MNTKEQLDRAAALEAKWGHILDLPVPTWTEPHALAYCAECVSNARYAVEIGTFVGMSALTMLRANRRLHLWCVDIFSAFEFNEAVATYFLLDYIRAGRCELIKGVSSKAAAMLQGRVLDVIWIDGGHSFKDVQEDIKCMMPLLKPGGTMIGHDFDDGNEVAQAVINSGYEFTLPVHRLWQIIKP